MVAAGWALSRGLSSWRWTSPTSDFISELGVPGWRLARIFRAGEEAAALARLHLGLSSIRSAKQALQTSPLPDPPRPRADDPPISRQGRVRPSSCSSHGPNSTSTDPITALLQRTMTALAAAALSTWTPTSDRTRARNLAR